LGYSQILRVDHKEFGEDTLRGWMGDIELDFLFNNMKSTQLNKSNYIGLKLISNLSYFSTLHQYYFKNELRYFTADGSDFMNRGYSYFRTSLFRKSKIHPEGVLQIQFDNIRKMDFRGLGMLGVTYIILSNAKHEIDTGLGGMYEYEEWIDFTNEDKIVSKGLFKSSMYIGWYTSIKNQVYFSFLQYYQVGYDQEDLIFRHRLNTGIEMASKFTEKIHWTFKTSINYESDPIVPVSPFLYEVSNGLRFIF